MQSIELPLVLFTVFSQAAIGMVLMRAVRSVSGHDDGSARNEWMLVLGLMGLGLTASLFHLGHPLEAYRALAHLKKAWLSREVLAAGAFLTLAAVATVSRNGRSALLWGAVVAGLTTVLASGLTYAPPSMPALNNALPTVFFLISVVVLGAGFASWFANSGSQVLLTRICTTALVTGLVVRLVAPGVWLPGGEIARLSGLAWLSSPLYWIGIAVMAACLGTLWKTRTIPVWLPVLALLGELTSRAAFFAETVHTAMNIGAPY